VKLLNKSFRLLFLIVVALLCMYLTEPAFAGIPSVQNVVVWNNGGNTILNVTVSHFPPSPPDHYLNWIEVNVSGTIHTFNLIQNVTTLIYPCNIGPIGTVQDATIQAHCNVDAYGPVYGPVQVPEFSLPVLLLTMVLGTILAICASRKIKC